MGNLRVVTELPVRDIPRGDGQSEEENLPHVIAKITTHTEIADTITAQRCRGRTKRFPEFAYFVSPGDFDYLNSPFP